MTASTPIVDLEAILLNATYRDRLEAIPAPGTGCHAALLGAATLGIRAGLDDGQLLSDIRASIPAGARNVADREIIEAIKRARMDTAPRGDASTWTAAPQRREGVPKFDKDNAGHRAIAAKLRARVIAAGGGTLHPSDPAMLEASPIKPSDTPEGDTALLLEKLYRPDDLLFIGARKSTGPKYVHPAATWATFFREKIALIRQEPPERQPELFAALGEMYPFIIPNPLSGELAPKASGGETLRGDNNIKELRYILAEFDGMPLEKQGGVLRGLCRSYGLRIAALVYSGNKSLHAWIIAEGIETREEWNETIKGRLFPILGWLGMDTANSNPARLSRLPGMFRRDPGEEWQRLHYLAPKGGAL